MAVQHASRKTQRTALSLAIIAGLSLTAYCPTADANSDRVDWNSIHSSDYFDSFQDVDNYSSDNMSISSRSVVDSAANGGADATEVYVLKRLLEQAEAEGNTELLELLALATTDEEAARLAGELTPDRSGANVYAVMQAQDLFADTIQKRTSDYIIGESAQTNIWATYLGSEQTSYINSDGTYRYDGFDSTTHGVAFGFDKMVAADTVFGVAFSQQKIEADGRMYNNSTDIDSFQAAAYGLISWNDIYFSARGIIGRNTHITSREIGASVGLEKHNEANGRTNSTNTALQLEATYPVYWQQFVFLPVVSANYSHVKVDGYSEDYVREFNKNGVPTKTTGSVASLAYDSQSYDELLLGVGLEAAHTLYTDLGAIQTRLGGKANFEVLDNDLTTTARLASGGDSFTVGMNSREDIRYQAYLDFLLETDGSFSWSLGVQHDWDESSENTTAYGRAIFSF